VTNLRRVILSFICGGSVILGITATSFAETPSQVNDSQGGPFYNAETKSYFQLFNHPIRGGTYSWAEANARAIRKRHKGERGRLAMVKDPKTLEFVREKFSLPQDTWIGVRFFCKYSKLLWADGKLQSPKVSGMWHSKWHRSETRCDGAGYMPIYLTAPGNGGVFWQASGPNMAHNFYLVEYPALKNSEDVSQSSNEQDMTVPAGASTTE
jgi:hypothetical protein